MLDETAAVGGLGALGAQPHFKGRERTGDREPGLGHDHGDGAQMGQPEPQPVDPAPAAKVARDHQHQAAHHEQHDRDMQREHGIGKQLIGHRSFAYEDFGSYRGQIEQLDNVLVSDRTHP